jgi:hypothetical protein
MQKEMSELSMRAVRTLLKRHTPEWLCSRSSRTEA